MDKYDVPPPKDVPFKFKLDHQMEESKKTHVDSIIELARAYPITDDSVIFGNDAVYNRTEMKHMHIAGCAGILNVSASDAIVLRHMTKEEKD